MIIFVGCVKTLKGQYKEICLASILKKEKGEIDEELMTKEAEFNRKKTKLEVEEKKYANVEEEELKSRIDKIDRNITTIKKQKQKREKQLIMNYFKKKRNENKNRIAQNSTKCEKLKENGLLVIDQIAKKKSEINQRNKKIID